MYLSINSYIEKDLERNKIQQGLCCVNILVRTTIIIVICSTTHRIGGSRDVITVRFRAASPDGLLLWSAEDHVIGNVSDYMAVGLRFGRIVFSFNVGSGELVLTDTTSGRLDDGHWHTVQLHRYYSRAPARIVICNCLF